MHSRILLAAIVLVAVLPVLPSPATPEVAAATTSVKLDQEQSIYTGGLSVRAGTTQTITAGVSGALQSIALPFCSTIAGTITALKVSSTSGMAPAVAQLQFSASYSDCAWYTFDFVGQTHINAGDVLTLLVTRQHGPAPLWGYDAAGGDPYPNGVGTWRGITINDFAFRTYVDTSG
jgi:hypothetical protein